jgi:hypothetical protein
VTINEHQRYQLHQALDTYLGPEKAATLMAYLPPVGWADVATKHDLTALEERIDLRLTAQIASVRTELHTGLGAVRSELHKGLGEVRTELHEGLRNMTLTCVGATTALVSLITILANRL